MSSFSPWAGVVDVCFYFSCQGRLTFGKELLVVLLFLCLWRYINVWIMGKNLCGNESVRRNMCEVWEVVEEWFKKVLCRELLIPWTAFCVTPISLWNGNIKTFIFHYLIACSWKVLQSPWTNSWGELMCGIKKINKCKNGSICENM